MQPLPPPLEAIFRQHSQPDTAEALFLALLPAICDVLHTDRCFLQIRQPDRRLYRIFCWGRDQFPDLTTDGWQPESPWEEDDPMFAAALRADPSIFVEDVETASSDVLNRKFEHDFGHRALVHAHICQDGVLWGILQPCLFTQPRVWSAFDRSIIDQLIDRLRPLVVQFGQMAAA